MSLVQTYVREGQKTEDGSIESPRPNRPPFTEKLNRRFPGYWPGSGLSADPARFG